MVKEEIKTEAKEKEQKSSYELIEVPTQTAIVIKELTTGNLLSESQALAEILNRLVRIEKATSG